MARATAARSDNAHDLTADISRPLGLNQAAQRLRRVGAADNQGDKTEKLQRSATQVVWWRNHVVSFILLEVTDTIFNAPGYVGCRIFPN